jgi:hypothetical protein
VGKLFNFKPKMPFKDGEPCDCPECISNVPCPICGRLQTIPIEKYDFRDNKGNKYEWRGEIRWPEVATSTAPGEMYYSRGTQLVIESIIEVGHSEGFVAMIMHRVPNNGK